MTVSDEINNKQKEILTRLREVYPGNLTREVLLKKLGDKADDILVDVLLLEEKDLIAVIPKLGDTFPPHLKITPKGIEKLRENFITKLKESPHSNPLMALSLLITLIFGMSSLYLYFENKTLQEEKALLERPLIITPDARVQGGSLAKIEFIVANPSRSIDYYFVDASCAGDLQFFGVPQIEINQKPEDSPNGSDNSIVVPLTQNRGEIIRAGSELRNRCIAYVKNPTEDKTSFLNICVKIRNIPEEICNKMRVTILKS